MSWRSYEFNRVGTYNRGIFRRFEALIFGMLSHDFMGDRVAMAMVPILDVLFRKGAVCRFLVSNDRVRLLSHRRTHNTHLKGHWAPRLHSPFTKKEQM